MTINILLIDLKLQIIPLAAVKKTFEGTRNWHMRTRTIKAKRINLKMLKRKEGNKVLNKMVELKS